MNSLLEYGRNGKTLPIDDVIDVHGHIGRYRFPIPDIDVANMVKVMDFVGVKATFCSHMQCMSNDFDGGNRAVMSAINAYPGRILGYVIVPPARGVNRYKYVENWLERGFSGIKLHDGIGIKYSESLYDDVYRIANERCLPILFHSWGADHEFDAFRQIAEKHENLSIIMAHSGCVNVGGYIEVGRTYPNVYLDPTFSRAPRKIIEEMVDGAGADKVLFGSDIYFLSLSQQIGRILGADISDEDKVKILSTNARKILDRAKR